MIASVRGARERAEVTLERYGAAGLIASLWGRIWMPLAGVPIVGRTATRCAGLLTPPHYGRLRLARYASGGYLAPSARISHRALRLGRHTLIGDRVVIYQEMDGGPVELADDAAIWDETWILTGGGGAVTIGARTHVQGRCHVTAYLGSVLIGADVQVGPACAFYPYDHGMQRGSLMAEQRLTTRGDIVIGDGAWLGFGVIVLSGVRIGAGAVVGAGSVVTSDVPDEAIAVGVPARVVGNRS